jgi:hypothetical protein
MKNQRRYTIPAGSLRAGDTLRIHGTITFDCPRLEDASIPVGADCEAVLPDEIIAEYERLRAENPS